MNSAGAIARKLCSPSAFLRTFLTLFLTSTIVTALVVYFFYELESESNLALISQKETVAIHTGHQLILDTIDPVVTDLFYLTDLSSHAYNNAMVSADNNLFMGRLETNLLLFASSHAMYDQIRIIDLQGQERIRVNHTETGAQLIDSDKLQNKFRRYYFQDTLKLTQNLVYISPLDLNIEQGEIEYPLNPMIRFGKVIFDSEGSKSGVVIVNYKAQNMLDKLHNWAVEQTGELTLLNKDGHWLHGRTPTEEWGFMIPERSEYCLKTQEPHLWDKIINEQKSGQLTTAKGIYTYATVRPLARGHISSSGSGTAHGSSIRSYSGEKYYWKMVSHVPTAAIKESLSHFRQQISAIYGVILGMLAVFSSLLARAHVRRHKAEREKEKLQTRLLHVQKMESVGRLAAGIAHEINTPTQFVGTNLEFIDEAALDIDSFFARIKDIADRAPLEMANDINLAVQDADWDYLSKELPLAISQSRDGVKRVSSIVLAMKEFSHPIRKEMELHDLNRIINTTVTVAGNEWRYIADMDLDLDEELPEVPLLADEMGQVILNMLVNASHSITEKLGDNPEGAKGTIFISTRKVGDGVEMRIRDTGMGIPEEARPHIFEPFYTTKEVGKGTGQGLAISHDVITEKHGGSIDFTSEPGRGAEFIIQLSSKFGESQ